MGAPWAIGALAAINRTALLSRWAGNPEAGNPFVTLRDLGQAIGVDGWAEAAADRPGIRADGMAPLDRQA